MTLFLGIDLGTSGIRCAVIDAEGAVVGMSRGSYPDSSAAGWWAAVTEGLHSLKAIIGADAMQSIQAAAIDGTSGSMVLVDATITPVTEPLMYNSTGFDEEATHIAEHAPLGDMTRGPSSALARLLRLQRMDADGLAKHLCHQADFIMAKLTGKAGQSDENNSLKTGYDVAARRWPAWINQTRVKTELLPKVHPVGTPIATVSPAIAAEFGFAPDLMLHAGTTDSIAAFLATGASQIGDVVTSLGTTLAIKMLSDVRIDDPAQGIYSHRLGDMWLVGGASNTGGGALLAHFSTDDLARLSPQIDPSTPSGLNYYPLPRKGERFPINDPEMEPVVTPKPADDALYLQGLLEGIAKIEARCYQALQDRGAPAITRIFTAGGGASNATWLSIRQQLIPQTFVQAAQTEAAIGVARLAARGHA
jgi:sugar (pentulose or hexulose) kinase